MNTMKNYPWWLENTFEDGVPEWALDKGEKEENKEEKADENVND